MEVFKKLISHLRVKKTGKMPWSGRPTPPPVQPQERDPYVAAVMAIFEPLRNLDPQLEQQAVRYVLDGGDQSTVDTILQQIKALGGPDYKLVMRRTDDGPNDFVTRIGVLHRHLSAAFVLTDDYDVDRAIRLLILVHPLSHGSDAGSLVLPLKLRGPFAQFANHALKYNAHDETWDKTRATRAWTVLEEVLTRLGAKPLDIATMLLTRGYIAARGNRDVLSILGPMDEIVAQHTHALPTVWAEGNESVRIQLLGGFTPFLDLPEGVQVLNQALRDRYKHLRESAIRLVKDLPEEAQVALGSELLNEPVAKHRATGVEVLRRALAAGHSAARAPLEDRLKIEKGAAVIRGLEAALKTDAAQQEATAQAETKDSGPGYVALDGRWIDIPPVRRPGPPAVPPPEALKEAILQAALAALNERVADHLSRDKTEPYWEVRRRRYAKQLEELPGEVDKVWSLLALPPDPSIKALRSARGQIDRLSSHIKDLPSETLSRIHPTRLVEAGLALSYQDDLPGIGYPRRARDPFSRAVYAWLMQDDGDLRFAASVARSRKNSNHMFLLTRGYSGMDAVPVGVSWPYLYDTLPSLLESLVHSHASGPMRVRILNYIKRLPAIPASAEQPLLDVAMGRGKAADMAAKMLSQATDMAVSVARLLSDGRKDWRLRAAVLAARLDPTESLAAAVKDRLKVEKDAGVRAALIGAMQSMGEDVSAYTNVEVLSAEAEAGLKKAAKTLPDWLPFTSFGDFHLADGSTLPPDVIRWWAAQAIAFKLPGGGPATDLWLGLLAPEDAARLGSVMLDAWIAEDTRVATEADASKKAQEKTAKYTNNPTLQKSLHESFTKEIQGTVIGSASKQSGLLAFTARMEGGRLAMRARAYLKDHSKRVPASTALIAALATHGSREALTVLSTQAIRLPQKTLRAAAEAHLAEIGQARGWTAEALADRMAPTAGLDASGRLALAAAEKTFEARLGDDLTLALFNPEGRAIKALPGGPETEAIRKTLTQSKKDVKATVAQQSARLRDAMAIQRSWTGPEWREIFGQHPILGRLAQRLVWCIDGVAVRPSEEGEFLDVDDTARPLSDNATVSLAHPVTLGEEATAAWATLLEEEEITQPFDQISRPVLGLPNATADSLEPYHASGTEAALADASYEGWTVPGNRLKTLAKRLGWLIGAAEEHAIETYLHRDFGEGELSAVLTHGGIDKLGAPQEKTALLRLGFTKGQPGSNANLVPLADVPPVLLSEMRTDLQNFAKLGEFDPDWQKGLLI